MKRQLNGRRWRTSAVSPKGVLGFLLIGKEKNMTDVDARKEDFGRAKENLDGERKEADEQANRAKEEADRKQKEAVK